MTEPWTLCGECDRGLVWAGITCTCDPGPEGQHHPYCCAMPCPNGCWDKLRPGEALPVPQMAPGRQPTLFDAEPGEVL